MEELAWKFVQRVFWEPLMRSIPEPDLRDIRFVPRTPEDQRRAEVIVKLFTPKKPQGSR